MKKPALVIGLFISAIIIWITKINPHWFSCFFWPGGVWPPGAGKGALMVENPVSNPALSGPMVSGSIPRDRAVVAVIDGLGGVFGVAIVKELRETFGDALEIWALGANSSATAAMMKAGANRGATGEGAVRVSLPKAMAVMGPLAITWANAMMGEITPGLAEAVMKAEIPKILLPVSQENVILAGYKFEPLSNLLLDAIRHLARQACLP